MIENKKFTELKYSYRYDAENFLFLLSTYNSIGKETRRLINELIECLEIEQSNQPKG